MFNLDKNNTKSVNKFGIPDETRRSNRNVRAMQMFYELKQQFPTIPDHVLTERIHSHAEVSSGASSPVSSAALSSPATPSVTAASSGPEQGLDSITVPAPKLPPANTEGAHKAEVTPMNNHAKHLSSEDESHQQQAVAGRGADAVNSPLHAEIQGAYSPQKPPKSVKKMCSNNGASMSTAECASKESPKQPKRERPTTLNLQGGAAKPPINTELNTKMNVSFQCESVLKLTPSLSPQYANNQRSFTSVNLTLRPPATEPQAPIDITSKNASLTYSTSSFDSQKGLESRLQITVSPNGGSVSSYRRRPHSYHALDEPDNNNDAIKSSMGSLQDLSTSTVLVKQQTKLDKLRIELRSEKLKLIAMQREIAELEASKNPPVNLMLSTVDNVDNELEKQLLKEIRHLRVQCERLTHEVDQRQEHQRCEQETEFYRNIYVGQRVGTNFGRMASDRRMENGQNRANIYANFAHENVDENDGYFWSCPKCTFQNHPLINKCEQCDMAHIVHGMVR